MKVERKSARPMDSLMIQYVKSMGISASHNTRRIFMAWDEVSGAGQWCLKKFFRDGTLYITLGSSVARSMLEMQRDVLIKKINEKLDEDELFIKNDPRLRKVEKLVLK